MPAVAAWKTQAKQMPPVLFFLIRFWEYFTRISASHFPKWSRANTTLHFGCRRVSTLLCAWLWSMSPSPRLAVAVAGWLGSVQTRGLHNPSGRHHTVTCWLVMHGLLAGCRSLGYISISPSVDSTAVFGNSGSGS